MIHPSSFKSRWIEKQRGYGAKGGATAGAAVLVPAEEAQEVESTGGK